MSCRTQIREGVLRSFSYLPPSISKLIWQSFSKSTNVKTFETIKLHETARKTNTFETTIATAPNYIKQRASVTVTTPYRNDDKKMGANNNRDEARAVNNGALSVDVLARPWPKLKRKTTVVIRWKLWWDQIISFNNECISKFDACWFWFFRNFFGKQVFAMNFRVSDFWNAFLFVIFPPRVCLLLLVFNGYVWNWTYLIVSFVVS